METYIAQFRKLWNELGASQKASILLSVTGVMVGVGALLIWAGRTPMQLLFGRLEPADMSEVVAALEEKGVPYTMDEAGTSIYVPPDKVHAIRMQLANDGVLNGGGVGFEIFDEGNFGISDFVQRTNYIRAVQGELSRTIAQLRGVRSARVMIVVPENKLLLDRTRSHSTASVFVDTAGAKLGQDQINSIRFLVANAVEGLEINDVAVVDNNGNVLSEEVRTDETIGLASSQLRLRKDIEDYYTNKIETMLNRVIGAGQVVARVSIDLDTEAQTIVEERYDPESQVVRSQTSAEDTASSTESRPNQVVGVAANLPDGNAGPQNASGTNSTNENSKNKSVTYEINRETREIVKRPGSINRISAAVFVAMNFQDSAGTEEATPAPRTEEEMIRLREMVANALGVVVDSEGREVRPLVSIEEVSFMANPLGAVVSNELSSPIFKILEAGRSFLSVGIAVIMFMVFLRMLKQHKVKPINVEVIEDESSSPVGIPTGSGKVNSALDVTPRPTPELLNELIQQKPENVGTALKKWMATTNN